LQLYGSLIVVFAKLRSGSPNFQKHRKMKMQFLSPTLCEDQPARVWKRIRDFTSRFIGGPGCGYGDFMRFRDVLSLVYHVKVMKNIDDKIHVFCTAIPVISNGTADVTLGVLFN